MRSRVRAQLTARRQPDRADYGSRAVRIFHTYLHRRELALLKDRDDLKQQLEELVKSLEGLAFPRTLEVEMGRQISVTEHVKDLYPGPWCDFFPSSWMGYHPQGLVEAWGYHAEGFVEERIDLHDRVPWASYMASRRRRRRASLMASRRRRLSEICSKTRDQNARSELLSALNQLLDITEKVAKVDLSLAEIRVQRALAARSNLRYWWVGILFVLILVGRYLFGGVEGEIEAIVCVLAARFLLNPEMERDCEARILSAQDRADTVRWRLDEFGKSRDALWDSTFENDAEGKPGS